MEKISKYNNKFSQFTRSILLNHYEWCKREGRDTSWFKKSPVLNKKND